MIRNILLSLFIVGSLQAQPVGEPPVRAPYPENIETSAANTWWKVAQKAREGKYGNAKRHPKGSVTVTGRHFNDLLVPRNEVVAFALYTVHNNTLKLSAQLHPLYPQETRTVRIEFDFGNGWEEAATATVNDLGWSALFRIENWDDSKTVPYRVRHGADSFFEGSIRKNPIDQDEIVVASLSCNSSRDRNGRPHYVRNLLALDPDLLFFAGDQHYDHTEHTAGWIMFGEQFKETFRHRPVVTIPDDHDVGQANLWGENGIKASHPNGNSGGYFYHPTYVQQVQRCQTAHLPDPVDPEPIGQNIGVYFTSYNLGGIDFAILEDRKFKTGPKDKIPQQGPRPDHIRNPEYDYKSIDLPELVLLGDRQLNFLEQWSRDWDGVSMKAVLSQTAFAGAAHLHGGPDPIKHRLHADLDSNGWPQTGRNNALRAMRKGFALHIAGDQHLGTLFQNGIDEFNDGPWTSISPAIVNSIYGRYWHPEDEQPGANPPENAALPYTGEYFDGFHNKITMHAYANANEPQNKESKAAGFDVIRFNKVSREITVESWPRFVDLSQPGAQQFVGWPKTVPQLSNFNPPSWGKLGELRFDQANPVVQLLEKDSGEILYTLRIAGNRFTPHAPAGKVFEVRAGINEPNKVIVDKASVGDAKTTHVQLP